MKRVSGVRGATKVLNEEADIVDQLASLYDTLLRENNISEADIISLIFSVSADITAKNPAAALRQSGRAGELPLFSTQEPQTDGAPEGIIRLLMHCYMDENRKAQHIFRNGAEVLRPDLVMKRGKAPPVGA
jgi:chorismate mutase